MQREEDLRLQEKRLREGLTLRVLRQWLLRLVSKCLKGWTAYVMRRRLLRQIRSSAGAAAARRGCLIWIATTRGGAHPRRGLAETVSSMAAAVTAIPGYL